MWQIFPGRWIQDLRSGCHHSGADVGWSFGKVHEISWKACSSNCSSPESSPFTPLGSDIGLATFLIWGHCSLQHCKQACFQNLEEVQQRLNSDVRKMRFLDCCFSRWRQRGEHPLVLTTSIVFCSFLECWGSCRIFRCRRLSLAVDFNSLGDITLVFTNSCSSNKVLRSAQSESGHAFESARATCFR